MQIEILLNVLNVDFFTGVPDSLLSTFMDWLDVNAEPAQNIVAANEGNAAAIAAGYHLATGKIPLVYLQNSGIGNMVNPAASLLHPSIYGIPCVFLVGWRGEPGFPDEPQHLYQGLITIELLHTLGIETILLTQDLTAQDFVDAWESLAPILKQGKSIAIVVEKGALSYHEKASYANAFCLNREDALESILQISEDDPVICTTGKAGENFLNCVKLYRIPMKKIF